MSFRVFAKNWIFRLSTPLHPNENGFFPFRHSAVQKSSNKRDCYRCLIFNLHEKHNVKKQGIYTCSWSSTTCQGINSALCNYPLYFVVWCPSPSGLFQHLNTNWFHLCFLHLLCNNSNSDSDYYHQYYHSCRTPNSCINCRGTANINRWSTSLRSVSFTQTLFISNFETHGRCWAPQTFRRLNTLFTIPRIRTPTRRWRKLPWIHVLAIQKNIIWRFNFSPCKTFLRGTTPATLYLCSAISTGRKISTKSILMRNPLQGRGGEAGPWGVVIMRG